MKPKHNKLKYVVLPGEGPTFLCAPLCAPELLLGSRVYGRLLSIPWHLPQGRGY